MSKDKQTDPTPNGELALQFPILQRDTNAFGDISGGWLIGQMDTAATIAASRVASGRVVTVALDNMSFLTPIHVGALLSCYTQIVNIGRSSIQVVVEAWIEQDGDEPIKITEGFFVLVAIDNEGRTRTIAE